MPYLERMAKEGVHADRMIPSFPTDTWPAMTTLSTGLYAESHGIISNKFMDLDTKTWFSYDYDPNDYYKNGRFFKQEPLWLTNQKQGGNYKQIYNLHIIVSTIKY